MTHKNAQHFAHGNELDARRHQRPRPPCAQLSPDHKTAFKSKRMALQFVAAPVALLFSLSSPLLHSLSLFHSLPLSLLLASFILTVILAPFCQTWQHGTVGQRQKQNSSTISFEAQNKRQLVCCSHVYNGGGEGEEKRGVGRVDYTALDCSLNRSCLNDVLCIICIL